jgi:hypothetical protein
MRTPLVFLLAVLILQLGLKVCEVEADPNAPVTPATVDDEAPEMNW